jgi:hypothetical protein
LNGCHIANSSLDGTPAVSGPNNRRSPAPAPGRHETCGIVGARSANVAGMKRNATRETQLKTRLTFTPAARTTIAPWRAPPAIHTNDHIRQTRHEKRPKTARRRHGTLRPPQKRKGHRP